MPNRVRRARRHFTTALIGVALALSVAIPATLAQGETVVITSSLEPASLEVAPGTAVTWRNDDADRHRIRSREGPERFDSENLDPGESFTFTFTIPGTYPYVDHVGEENPAYFGTIIVTADPDDTTATGELPTSEAVTIGDRVFIPPTVEIAAGGTVEWTNNDSESHTATASDGTFDSGILGPGATFTQSFDTAGTFPFFCQIHPEMQGTITVSDQIEAVSSPTASLGATSPAPSPDASLPLPSAATSATVTLADRAFDPTSVEVPVGGGVDWSNEDQEGHTITASDGSFDSGVVGPGEAFSTTFEIAGTYDYFCAIHPEMQARVVVVDSVSGPVPESPGVSNTPGPGG